MEYSLPALAGSSSGQQAGDAAEPPPAHAPPLLPPPPSPVLGAPAEQQEAEASSLELEVTLRKIM